MQVIVSKGLGHIGTADNPKADIAVGDIADQVKAIVIHLMGDTTAGYRSVIQIAHWRIIDIGLHHAIAIHLRFDLTTGIDAGDLEHVVANLQIPKKIK